jgi:hypothetical protein
MHFALVAGGLVPVCAQDLSTPDRPRLDMLVDAIVNCQYSLHDLSKVKGEGLDNYARFNMPIEMGMALFHALQTQRAIHRCAFFIEIPHGHIVPASDLAGLDPKCYDSDPSKLVALVYDWLRSVVTEQLFNNVPTVQVQAKFKEFQKALKKIHGSGSKGRPNHNEAQELMYQLCGKYGWWDWRANKAGKIAFPPLPLSWK